MPCRRRACPFSEEVQTGRAGGQVLWGPGPCTIPLARLQALASGTGQAKATQSSDIVEPDGC